MCLTLRRALRAGGGWESLRTRERWASNSGSSLQTHPQRPPSLNSNPEPKPLTATVAWLCRGHQLGEKPQVFGADTELPPTAGVSEVLSRPVPLPYCSLQRSSR